jgi:hypothetical protein
MVVFILMNHADNISQGLADVTEHAHPAHPLNHKNRGSDTIRQNLCHTLKNDKMTRENEFPCYFVAKKPIEL